MPGFALNGCTYIVKEPRWQHSPSLSAYTHTNYKYKLPLPMNVRATLAPLTFEYRDKHIPIVSLHVHTGQIGTDTHAHERGIQTLCTLNWSQTLRRICTKLYGGNVPNYTAAMYQTVRRQCTKLYGGNWRWGRGGTLKKYPGKSRKPKAPQRWPYTTKAWLTVCAGGTDCTQCHGCRKNNNLSLHPGSTHACFLGMRRNFLVPFRTLTLVIGIIVEHYN